MHMAVCICYYICFKTKPLFTYNLPLLSPKTSNFRLHHKYIFCEFRSLESSLCFFIVWKSCLKILQNLSFLRSTETFSQFHFVLSITIYNGVIQLLPRSADIAYILKCAVPCLKNVGLPFMGCDIWLCLSVR